MLADLDLTSGLEEKCVLFSKRDRIAHACLELLRGERFPIRIRAESGEIGKLLLYADSHDVSPCWGGLERVRISAKRFITL
jgi:hypothetical protein